MEEGIERSESRDLQIYTVPVDVYRALEEWAKEECASISAIARRLLVRHVRDLVRSPGSGGMEGVGK